jgi:demethylmenaquinone methyltransferase/2-methoxy-6-polyprenyl-1,4-benzoquinol methylase
MMQEKTDKNKIDFGFQEVDYVEKQKLVGKVFESVAPKYDIMNDFMSFGLHRVWKKIFISKVKARKNLKILDLASGTGDISFSIAKKLSNRDISDYQIVASDINPEMLKVAKQRALDKNFLDNFTFKEINCEEIPFDNNSFDYITIAFGIRNVTDREKALKEIYRVLKPGGKFLCLEFSEVDNKNLKSIYDFYSFNIIPKIGKYVAKDEDSYQYLVESIRKFPNAEEFSQLIDKAGFTKTSYEKLNSGIVAIHQAYKI